MATYETVIVVPRSIEDTFAFVSNFQNAALWDPRTYAAEKKTAGAVGQGTRFVLNGGPVPLHIFPFGRNVAKAIFGMPLIYDVVSYEPPYELELEGENAVFRYRDRLELVRIDAKQTRLIYSARLDFKGPLKIGEPLLKLMFKQIGDDATASIAATCAKNAASTYPDLIKQPLAA